ncbi:hypothetical protein G6F40_017395 [Rhizopus arrhizus]|nr:hypothetical protein G6F40_017395 [Rhizopus arrhizus]
MPSTVSPSTTTTAPMLRSAMVLMASYTDESGETVTTDWFGFSLRISATVFTMCSRIAGKVQRWTARRTPSPAGCCGATMLHPKPAGHLAASAAPDIWRACLGTPGWPSRAGCARRCVPYRDSMPVTCR